MTTHTDRRRIFGRRARFAALYMLAALAALLCQPTQTSAQWTTSGNNISNTNTGNVGVGTSNPANAKLEIVSDDGVAAGEHSLLYASKSGTSSGGIKFGYRADGTSVTGGYIRSLNNLSFFLGTTGTPQAVTIDNSGNFGIGTLTPNRRLELVGDVGGLSFEAATGSPNSGAIRFGDSTGWKFHFGRSRESVGGALNSGTSGVLMTIQDNGNVGIGTASPTTKLDVAGFGKFEANGAGVSVRNTNSWTQIVATRTASYQAAFIAVPSVAYSTANPYWAMGLSPDGSTGWSLDTWDGTNLITRMRMLAGGDVGIGTAAPASARLHLYSPGNTYLRIGAPLANQSSIAFNDDSYGQDIVLYRPESTRDFVVWTATAGNAMRVMQSGSIGVGTNTPGYKFDVQGGQINASGGLCIAGDCKTAWSQVGGGSSQWTTSGSNIYFNTGNVGIGTTSPGASLDVAGNPANAIRTSYLTISASNTGATDRPFIRGTNTHLVINGYGTNTGGTLYLNYPGDLAAGQTASTRIQETMFISATGNGGSGSVGIGTATPGSKLFVGTGTPAVATLAGLNVALGGNSYISASNGTVNTFIGSDTSSYGIVGTLSNHPLGFRANNTLAMSVMPDGKVGVGTTAPATALHVVGDVTVTGNIAAKYQDVAEWVPSSQKLAAGTVVVLDPVEPNHVLASTAAYDTKVAGVISARPGLTLGEAGDDKALVATTGRVRVKVDATHSPIKVGDLLVTSDVPGLAMKSQPLDLGGVPIHRPGTLIGKALEPLASGKGEILVLLSLQ